MKLDLPHLVKTVASVVASLAVVEAAVPHAPSVASSGAVVGGSALVAAGLQLAESWFTNTKNARLDKLAAAIDKAVDARLAAQKVPDPA